MECKYLQNSKFVGTYIQQWGPISGGADALCMK